MFEVDRSDIIGEPAFLPVVRKGIHGGFFEKSDLVHDEEEYCKRTDWIEPRVRFRCSECSMYHETAPDQVLCVSRQVELDIVSSKLTNGYRLSPDLELPESAGDDYAVYLAENVNRIDTTSIDEKSIFFIPETSRINLYEPTGRVVIAPLNRLSEMFVSQQYDALIEDIHTLIGRTIEWEKLDSQGSEFQEITYRLISRDERFHNVSPGGTAADQGKDGYCYREIGRRDEKIMVQVKFNNNGSGQNAEDIIRMATVAESHDCTGLLVSTVKTTGDLETKLGSDTFLPRMRFLDVWNGAEVRERLSTYPELVQEYFTD